MAQDMVEQVEGEVAGAITHAGSRRDYHTETCIIRGILEVVVMVMEAKVAAF